MYNINYCTYFIYRVLSKSESVIISDFSTTFIINIIVREYLLFFSNSTLILSHFLEIMLHKALQTFCADLSLFLCHWFYNVTKEEFNKKLCMQRNMRLLNYIYC